MPADSARIEEVRRLAAAVASRMVDFRRNLHADPELGLEERATADKIRAFLKESRAEVLPPLIGTDTVAVIHGAGPGRKVALRADIDALALEDKGNYQWRSRNAGVSHSCGHDGHTAMLTGAALVLSDLADTFSGSIQLVFQPAEETLRGARALVEAGLFSDNPPPDAIFGLHGRPGLPFGTFSGSTGPAMAGSDIFTIRIKGRGGHGASPHLAVNPVLTAARIVQALQETATQTINPLEPVVVSVCRIQAGHADNVIPETALVTGTVRYFQPEVQQKIRDRMAAAVSGCCAVDGTDHELEYREGCPPLINAARYTDFARDVARRWFGEAGWQDGLSPTTGSEDFAYYLQQVPGAFLWLGLGDADTVLHNPQFDFNDEALVEGITYLCALALEWLAAEPDESPLT